jgi:hypothetical protein
MQKFYVTKKKYDWIVRCDDEEFGLAEEREDAIETARARARDVVAKGGEAEVYVVNTVGMWDRVQIDG